MFKETSWSCAESVDGSDGAAPAQLEKNRALHLIVGCMCERCSIESRDTESVDGVAVDELVGVSCTDGDVV